MMFGFRCNAGYMCAEARVSSYAISGREGNEYNRLFVCLVQYGTTGICPPFCCNDLFMTILNCGLMLISIFNSKVQCIPCQCNSMRQARQCWRPKYDQSRRCWVCYEPSCIEVHYNMATRINLTDWRPRIRTVLWCTFVERHFCSEWRHW
jgi:hypothetical protein